MSATATPLSIDAIRARPDTPTNNLAMLPAGFTRFAQALSKDFLSLASTVPSFTYEKFCRTEAQLEDETEENSSVSGHLVCGELKRIVSVTIDRSLVFGLCNVVFGGVGNEPPFAETRPFSKIEIAIAQLFLKTVGRSLPAAFATVTLKEFFAAKPQDPNEEPEYPPFKPFVSVKFLCNIHGYSGELTIELPEELASLFRPVDEVARVKEELKMSEWGHQISHRVESIDVELVAVLSEFQMSIDGVTNLHAGQLIKLENDISSPLEICSEGVKLFSARLGQNAQKFCLSIEMPIAVK